MQVTAIGLEAVEDLAGQFARRAQHQHAARLAFGAALIGEEMVQDRERKRRGLAGAGLGDPDRVAA